MINIILIDDHDLVRVGIKRLLADVKGISVIGEGESGEEAVLLAREHQPNVMLLDANMPGIGGLEACRRILRHNPEIRIIALTVHSGEPYPSRFLQAGAVGYLTKGTGVNEMVRAIRNVNSGQRYISAEVAQELALRPFNSDSESPFEMLSEREMQVMLMITSGEKVQKISDTLCLSPKTVNSYRYRLFEKLGIENDVKLTHLAIRHGIIDPLLI